MEADIYLLVSEAIKDHSSAIQISVRNTSTFDKIVWSNWDSTLGPELRFVWEIEAGSPLLSDSVSRDESNASGYEEIDDLFDGLQSELLACHNCGRIGCTAQSCNKSANSPIGMSESQSTVGGQTSASSEDLAEDEDGLRGLKLELTNTEIPEDEELNVFLQRSRGSTEILTKDNINYNEETLNTAEESAASAAKSEECSINLPSSSSAAKSEECSINLPSSSEGELNFCSEFSRQDSDEYYAVRHILSGEICRSHFNDNMVEHKLILAEERRLLIASFSFVAKPEEGERTVQAVALLANIKRLDWYLERLSLIQQLISDVAGRLKAAITLGSREEIICRMTTEWTQFLDILANLDRWPLSPSDGVKIQDTYLSLPKCEGNTFLAEAITATLVTKGNVVVIGVDANKVHRLLLTLLLFLPEEERWQCLRPFACNYSPYVKLQGINMEHEEHVNSVKLLGVQSNWNVALIDLNKRCVYVSCPYAEHRLLRLEAQKQELARIIGAESGKLLKLDFRRIGSECSVKLFLQRIDRLPQESSVRLAFVQQFLALQAQKALAFIAYIQDITRNNDKCIELWRVRKALDLTNDLTFNVILTMADRIKPHLAEFLYRKL